MAGIRVGAAFSKSEDRFTLYSSIHSRLAYLANTCSPEKWPFSLSGKQLQQIREQLKMAYPLRQSQERTKQTRRDSRHPGYGIPICDPETVRKRYQLRSELVKKKLKVADWCLYVAFFGLFLAVFNAESLAAQQKQYSVMSPRAVLLAVEVLIALSTLSLDMLIFLYYSIELKMDVIETGNSHWQLGLTRWRVIKLFLELFICSLCPFPGAGHIKWPILGANIRMLGATTMPLPVLLCLPMFLRVYLACRRILLHSALFQDSTTKAVANFNHVTVDFMFVVKSQLCERPLTFVTLTTIVFWGSIAWMLTQCERYAHVGEIESSRHIMDFVWFEVVTFFSIGYGDVKVYTYCGRILAILTGIVGTLMSSLLIAIVGRQMQLSLSEKRVNHVIAESQLSATYKHCAASVLQCTWKAVKWRRCARATAPLSTQILPSAQQRIRLKLPREQRNLFIAIMNFRKSRWKLRMRMEEEDSFVAFRRSYADTLERILAVRRKQLELKERIETLTQHVDSLKQIVHKEADTAVTRSSPDKPSSS